MLATGTSRSVMEMIHRTLQNSIETPNLEEGGLLYPEQQNVFTEWVKRYSGLLSSARFIPMTRSQMEIGRLYAGRPITFHSGEGDPSRYSARVLSNKVTLTTEKLTVWWPLTHEVLRDNLEGPGFEGRVMRLLAERHATDLELLGMNGDTAFRNQVVQDEYSRLYRALDGLYTLASNKCRVLDAEGTALDHDLFRDATRMLPKAYKQDRQARWYVGMNIWEDYVHQLSQRVGSAEGTAALSGRTTIRPGGYEAVPIAAIPEDLAAAASGNQPAQIVARTEGPFRFKTSGDHKNNVLRIKVDAAATLVVTFPEGVFLACHVAALIRAAAETAGLTTLVVETTPEDTLKLSSTTTGTGAQIVLEHDASSPFQAAMELFGAEVNELAGGSLPLVATGTNDVGTLQDGSFMLLTRPDNILVGMAARTRVFSKYVVERDQIEITIFNEMAIDFEDEGGVVLVKNIRPYESTN